MLDFMKVSTRETKAGLEIYPKFIVRSSDDLMIKGSDFYAVWNEDEKLWSTKEEVALYLIDREIDDVYHTHSNAKPDHKIIPKYMWDSDSGMIDKWHKYVQRQCRDNYIPLDEKLIFSNEETTRKSYASRKLPYPLETIPTPAWDEIVGTLYNPEERHKIEWAIGAVVAGDSKDIQKFLVMYGAPGTGKSTIINIIQDLFAGYWKPFDAKKLGSANASFALEDVASNPLVAIQHDGDLSKIADNSRLNSLISHETMVMNEKFRTPYTIRFNSFLIMATNSPVKITDSKSGIIRRLIDVSPSGKKLPRSKYNSLMATVKFELGGIANKCLEVYKENPSIYDDYVATAMIGASNDFYNFVLDSYDVFKRDDSTTLKAAYEMYKIYCEDARVPYPYPLRMFKEELKSYFKKFEERSTSSDGDGLRARNVYSGFIADKFISLDANEKKSNATTKPESEKEKSWLEFQSEPSIFDDICKEWPAQYSNENGTPVKPWDQVRTKLGSIDTRQEHYLYFPDSYKNWIVIDFDLKDETGEKSLELNIREASKWPATYAELSKSGKGIHLHYIYNGDVSKLSRIYDDSIEVKVFTGKSSLRRRLTKCVNMAIATISTGLPIKDDKKVIDFEGFKNERALRTYIKRCCLKEYAPHATKPSIDYIYNALEKAYESGIHYDVSDLASAVISFAGRSSHNAEYCMSLTAKMKWKSEEMSENFEKYDSDTIVFFDVEVFKNLFVVVYKAEGKNPVKLINPTPADISELVKFKLIGFNNRDYDNHILYARMLGESNEQLYARSQAIIHNDRNAKIGASYNISYTDIYDFAAKKQSLKKWEIALGIHHQELGIPWDQEVPEDKWELVADYCVNDVLATEAVFTHLKGDFTAREILASLAGGTANDSTNSLTAKLIFGSNRKPQAAFQYRNLAEPVYEIPDDMREFLEKNFPKMMAQKHGKAQSILPYFEGYVFDISKPRDQRSYYRGHYVGEGGFVWSDPGMYANVITFDVESEHPHSACAEYLFGKYTQNFYDILQSRLAIKHEDFEKAKTMFGGRLAPFLGEGADPKGISSAEKIAINAVYGLTAQVEKDGYQSPFRDKRNVDNIVAKRGALFMVDLLEEVKARGGLPIHCKTDSIKVVDPTPELQEFILGFGEKYGYRFEIEHKFEKICLVNDAVYIAKVTTDDADWVKACKKAAAKGNPEPTRWTATGTQFAVPYVFKTLFSKEPIEFSDYCETKSVAGDAAIYVDMNEGLPEGEHNYIFVGRVGQFTPILPGNGAGELFRINGDKIGAVAGTKGYRWLESEVVRLRDLQDKVDTSYYKRLADDAVTDISKFGDFEWFVS